MNLDSKLKDLQEKEQLLKEHYLRVLGAIDFVKELLKEEKKSKK